MALRLIQALTPAEHTTLICGLRMAARDHAATAGFFRNKMADAMLIRDQRSIGVLKHLAKQFDHQSKEARALADLIDKAQRITVTRRGKSR